ncbi:MAG: hypothetical protein OQL10_10615 [Sedimenticola sp.]|uniref:Uncharacterized protein n=1 Tax=Sedimenticola thiotaurini TaxID=1543721 RepID=A0A558D0N0_9GAMM|nr:hypothetical protein [Sedimenticola sp.]TVT54560.1 MAG: hypothetical protein FHK82_10225 [Sedimenticola thiotaurini]
MRVVMGNVADFSKYKARRDYVQNLLDKGWMPDRVDKALSDSISIYIYDDYTQLLLFSNVQQANLEKIIQRVTNAEEENLLSVAENLSALISDFGVLPPFQGDRRLSAIAQTAVWFAGFSLSLINAESMKRESLVIFRLVDIENCASTFHLAHLAWPEVMERASAESYLAGMARSLRRELFGHR